MKKLRITIGQKTYDVTVEVLGESPPPRHAAAPGHRSPEPLLPPSSAPAPASQPPAEAGTVTSPLAGVIKSVLVKVGDSVKKGQALVILEAMKMENQVASPIAATVQSINVSAGDSVREGQVLLVLEQAADG